MVAQAQRPKRCDPASLPVVEHFHTGSGSHMLLGPLGPAIFDGAWRALLRSLLMALLDTFRCTNFIYADDMATNTESKGGGHPRYGGEPQKLSEYSWRVRARMTREALLPEEEQKKLGPLGLRLVEGLSGSALRIAQLIDTTELAGEKGAEKLLDRLNETLKPRRIQEARELYMAGAQQNGMLSRQQGEPMATYLVRCQAWYEAMVPKTRTVYFAVQGQHQDDDDHCYMAQRYNAVPPPSSLQGGFVTPQLTPVTTPAPTPDRRHMDDQLVPVTQVSEGAVLTQDELDNFMLVSALGVS